MRLLLILTLVLCADLAEAADKRVLIQPDGAVIILTFSEQARKPGESDADFVTRKFQRTLEKNPQWQGLPFVDLPASAIPQETHGTKRHQWRLQGQQIVVSSTVPDTPPSKAQRRKEACAKIQQDANASPGLQELCATF